jgi:CHAT domain-containing protein
MVMTAGSFEQLQALSVLQAEALAALTALGAAGDRPPNDAYERYLAPARKLLKGSAAYVAAVPGGLDLAGLARPVVQQLGMYADHLQADGDRAGADALRQEADTITACYLDEAATAEVRRDRAMLAATEGRFNEALSGLESARSVFAADGKVLEQVQTELKIANVYEWLGDYERALAALETAHAAVAPLLEQGPPTQSTVNLLIKEQFEAISSGAASSAGTDAMRLRGIAYEVIQAQARNHRSLGDYDMAEQLFLQARPFLVELGLPAGIDFHLAMIAVARGDLNRAEQLLASVAPQFEQPTIRWRRGALRQVQADVLLKRGRATDALAAADDGLADQPVYPDLDLAWKLQWRRARALTALGNGDALAAFRAAMNAADQLRMAPLGYRLDTTFLRDKLPMAHDAIDAALAAPDPGAVVWFVELIKSRALATVLSVPRTTTLGADEEASFDAVSTQIDALAFAQYSGTADANALHQRAVLLDQRDQMLESIRIRDPRWRALTEPVPVDVDAIRARLGPGRAVLVLLHRPGSVVSAVIDTAGVTAGSVELSPATTAALTAYAENLRRPAPDEFLADISQESGVTLADLLAPEVLTRATAVETLIVVPHGLLHLLPWSCLAVGPLAAGEGRLRRLFEHAAVGVLPNLASLPLLDADPVAAARVALIGNADYTGLEMYPALTESPAEITDIAAIYGLAGLVSPPREGADASEAAFWELATAARAPGSVLHVSGHGSLDASEPLASGLVLTGSTVDAAEILLRRLPYDEVVLSACSTGWRPMAAGGIELAGDDALGLPASFLEAGTRFLLASIPPVREKVARAFTVGWHRQRHAGLSPLAAVRAVQLELLASDPATVFSWAGMAAYGCR